jgi:ATP-binding cassette subfamily C protein LapB
VVSNGKIVMDDKKQVVLDKLAQGTKKKQEPANDN